VRGFVNDEKRKRRQAKNRKELPYFDDEPIDDRYPSEGGLGRAFLECEDMGVDWESTDWDAY